MRSYPVFLHLQGRPCLVVGAGPVGVARARGLAEAGAAVRLVDPRPRSQALGPGVEVVERPFEPADCEGRLLVFACTGHPSVDEAVARAARAAGALACVAADGGQGDFASAAVLRRGDVAVAVSTSGASPVLAAHLRDRLAATLGPQVADAARLLGAMRRRLAGSGVPRPRSRAAQRRALEAGLLDLVGQGREAEARRLLERLVEEATMEEPCTR